MTIEYMFVVSPIEGKSTKAIKTVCKILKSSFENNYVKAFKKLLELDIGGVRL